MTISEGTSGQEEQTPDLENEDRTYLQECITEQSERIATKAELRNINQNVQNVRPSESYFSKLDSNLKKNTAFVKKLKNFSSNQVDLYIKDMSGLNLTKYISEIAAAIVEAKLKMNDVAAAVKICCELHKIYNEFSQHLFENWQKALTIKMNEKISNPSKLRVDLRFYGELVSISLFNNKSAFSLLGSVLTILINMDRDQHLNISIILTFCKHCGDDFAGLMPRKVKMLSSKFNINVPKSTFLPPEKQNNVRQLLRDYFNSLSKHLVKDHEEIQEFEKQNVRILQTKGELSQERKEKLEILQISFDKLLTATQSFSDILDENLPELKSKSANVDDESMLVTGAGMDFDENQGSANLDNIWCDIETQKFYCNLPELQAFLPASFISKLQPVVEQPDLVTEEVLDSDLPVEELEEEGKVEEQEEEQEETTTITISNKIVLEAFINNLPNCINRELIDNAAIDFLVTLNNKHNRRKIVRTLFGVNRTRLDLLPFYGRFVAILYPALPEISNDLCQMLRQDFKYHVRKKDQINIESKVKVVRYIGELVKFNLYSKIEAMYCLKILLHDFSHHHIEMACNLLEVCGRYLFCHPDSHGRTKIYLEQMMRKKSVLTLDSRYVTQIENAYYSVNPPEGIAIAVKERPIMHKFIRKILYQDLHKTNTDKILRLMRKLDWNNVEIADYAVKCLTGAFNLKYFNIRCMANLLAGLVTYQEEVSTKVVDGVLEDIRLGMEVNLPKFNQRRVAEVKYLGELYNYRIVESVDIFKVLYSLISFGVTVDHNTISALDPPNHLFRIRLVCVLLETCGMYFSSGNSKRRLDYFLVFFQAYYWFKREGWGEAFPPPLEHLFKDTISSIRPKLKLCNNYEETELEIRNIRTTLGIERITAMITANEGKELSTLESIAETDNEDFGDEEISEAVTAPTDDTATEDEFVHPNQLSEDEDAEELSDNDMNQEDPMVSETDAIPSGPKRVDCPEDDDFLMALDKMVSENIQERMRESVKASVDISVPMVLKSNKKTYDQLKDADIAEKNTMGFVLMVRKGNKQQYKSFEADINSELAQNLRDQEQVQREEKERVKRLTLTITERFEEEDYQEMISQQQQQQRSSMQNLNRERKKYQHPKGAPDADLIFGPKKIR